MLLSASRKLVEETPRIYLLEEASAGGLKRPCASRTASDLAPRGRVVGLSCPCSSVSPCFVIALLGDLIQPLLAVQPEVQSCPSSEPAAPCPCLTPP